jgi:carbamoyltransferase
MRTEIDALVMEDFILYKEEQPPWKEKEDWRRNLVLD